MNKYIKILKEHGVEVIDPLNKENMIVVISEYTKDSKIEKIKPTYKDIYNYLGY